MGPICLGVIAKSRDGLARSEGFPPIIVPVGQHLGIPSRVIRPPGDKALATNFLMVMVYQCGKDVFLRRQFDWPYIWVAMPPDVSGHAVSETPDLGARNPWVAFSENLGDEDFASLDAEMAKWNSPKERDPDGDWTLDGFRSVFVNYAVQSRDWKKDLQRIQEWQAFNIKSPGAAIAEAKYWVAYAWHIRGSGYTRDVDPVALRVFRERMGRAEQVLKNAKSFASSNPLWYETYLDIAVATKRKEEFVTHLFEEGIRRHPYFQPLYTDMASLWTPYTPTVRDKADWRKVNKLVNQAVALTADIDGISNYARIYAELNSKQRSEFDLFRDGLVPWTKMRDSFEDLVKRYPSVANLNEFAGFACQVGDKDTFVKLKLQIKGRVLPEKWPGNHSPDLCDHMFLRKI